MYHERYYKRPGKKKLKERCRKKNVETRIADKSLIIHAKRGVSPYVGWPREGRLGAYTRHQRSTCVGTLALGILLSTQAS